MDDKLRELGRALVRVATVPDQKLGDERELGDRKIGCERSLFALLSDDAESWRAHVSIAGVEEI